MTAETIPTRRPEWACVFIVHPGSLVLFAAGSSWTTSFAPGCPCHIRKARAESGPHKRLDYPSVWLCSQSSLLFFFQTLSAELFALFPRGESTLPLHALPSCLQGQPHPPTPYTNPQRETQIAVTCKTQQETLSILQLWCWALILNCKSTWWLQEDLPWGAGFIPRSSVVANAGETEPCYTHCLLMQLFHGLSAFLLLAICSKRFNHVKHWHKLTPSRFIPVKMFTRFGFLMVVGLNSAVYGVFYLAFNSFIGYL